MPLSALRVIELGSLPAAAYCARLLADFGAEVIKVEPAGGDPMRLAAPMIGGESAGFAFLNFGKRSFVGDAAGLVAGADVAVVSETGFDIAAARAANPGLIVADISWFGRTTFHEFFSMAYAFTSPFGARLEILSPGKSRKLRSAKSLCAVPFSK